VGHDTLVRKASGLGRARDCDFQTLPPSVVATAAPSPVVVNPTAKQSVLVGHDTWSRPPTPLGSASDFQVAPPLVVANTAPCEGVIPTAQQSEAVRHNTPSRTRSLNPPGRD